MKYLHTLLLLFAVVTLTSCSTILHRKQQKINVFSNAENATITVNDSVYSLPAKVKLLRTNKPVTLSYQSENKQFDTIIPSKSGPLFYLGNLVTSPFFGAGYWVDLMNHKRFQYKKNIFINDKNGLLIQEYKADRYIAKRNITDTVRQNEIRENINKHFEAVAAKKAFKAQREFKRFNPTAGTFKFFMAPPTLSLIGLSAKNPNLDQFNNFVGGVGFGLGGDYYYKDNRFISLELSNRVNQFDDFWWSGHEVLARKLDISVRKGHRKNRFEYSYGISYTYTDYNYSLPRDNSPIKPFMSDDNRRHFTDSYSALGFSTLINYQLTSVMYIGVRYNPSIYSFRSSGKSFDYEHIIGFDYRLKF